MAAPRVFVSYARRDFYFAEQLAVALRRHGLVPWFDVHELATGTDWSAAIEEAIAQSDVVLLVASSAALASPHVRSEYARAVQLGRPLVAVRAGPVALPGELTAELAGPPYDLRSGFRRGAAALAADLTTGSLGGRAGRRLSLPGGALLGAAAPALSLVLALVLTGAFLATVLGQVTAFGPTVVLAVAGTVTVLGMLAGVAAYTLVSFLRRSISWRYLRGAFLTLPLLAIVAAGTVNVFAGALTDPFGAVLGVTPDQPVWDVAAALALLTIPACVAAALASELSAGLCRFLRTGMAPRRVRARHLRPLPGPPPTGRAVVQTYRLLSTDPDAAVAERVRRRLDEAGLHQVTGTDAAPDRDVVVVSDATPTAWLRRTDLRDPIAVAATSVADSLGGSLGRFQWVDHRRRRDATLRTLARSLTSGADPTGRGHGLPDVPERLQLLRLPVGVAVVEWTLFSLGVIAAQLGAYGLTRLLLVGPANAPWWSCLALLLAPAPFLLARLLRRRRLSLVGLVAAVAVFWAALYALGLVAMLRRLYPTYDWGAGSAVTLIYPALTAALLAVAVPSLLGWLPHRTAVRAASDQLPTLGAVRGSWVWLAIAIPALVTSVTGALLGS